MPFSRYDCSKSCPFSENYAQGVNETLSWSTVEGQPHKRQPKQTDKRQID